MKGILVIDKIPVVCEECPCCYDGYCLHLDRWLGMWAAHAGKPVDCQLKLLPQKIDVDVKKVEDIMRTEFQMEDVIQDKIIADIKLETDKLIALGWNSCINKILGK